MPAVPTTSSFSKCYDCGPFLHFVYTFSFLRWQLSHLPSLAVETVIVWGAGVLSRLLLADWLIYDFYLITWCQPQAPSLSHCKIVVLSYTVCVWEIFFQLSNKIYFKGFCVYLCTISDTLVSNCGLDKKTNVSTFAFLVFAAVVGVKSCWFFSKFFHICLFFSFLLKSLLFSCRKVSYFSLVARFCSLLLTAHLWS